MSVRAVTLTVAGEAFGLAMRRAALPPPSMRTPGTVTLRAATLDVTKETPAGVYPSRLVCWRLTATLPDSVVTWRAKRGWSRRAPSIETLLDWPESTTTVPVPPNSAFPAAVRASTLTVTGFDPGLVRMSWLDTPTWERDPTIHWSERALRQGLAATPRKSPAEAVWTVAPANSRDPDVTVSDLTTPARPWPEE